MLKKYIGKKMIKDGLMAEVIIPKLDDDGLKAYIGDYWFYFGGFEFEYTNPDDIPFDVMVEEIKMALDDFWKYTDFNDEYLYYYSILCERT